MEVIKSIIEGLNENAGAITGISTFVLACVTIYYAWVTRKILLNAQKPEIAITVRRIAKNRDRQETLIDLYVENIGGGPATDVKFTIDCNFTVPYHEWLRDVDFIKHGIGYFRQGKIKVCPFYCNSEDGYDELMQTPLNIKMTYKDSLHKKYDVPRCIDFREHEEELR